MQLLRAPQLEVKNSAFFSPSFLHTVCVFFFFFRMSDCIVEKEKKKVLHFGNCVLRKY